MKKTIPLIIVMTLLSGCNTTNQPLQGLGVAKPVQIPELPPELSKKAEALPPITDPSPEGIQKDGVATDIKYNEVAFQLNNLIKVYDCVKEAVNNTDSDNIDECLSE